jgi:hypothetical protein
MPYEKMMKPESCNICMQAKHVMLKFCRKPTPARGKHVMQKFCVPKFQHFASIIFRISHIAGAGAGAEIDLKI